MVQPYAKPWLSVADQLQQLIDRGMVVTAFRPGHEKTPKQLNAEAFLPKGAVLGCNVS